MRALVWHGPSRHTVTRVPEPARGDGEVIVSPCLVGICGSDVSAHKGTMGIARPGAIRGHEFGGIVVDAGATGIPDGARVSVDPVVSCQRCAACAHGRTSACEFIQIIGVHRPGALAELVAVPAQQVHVIPDRLDWFSAASAEPLAQAVHDVDLARDMRRPLGRALVIGAGSIGSWVVGLLSQRGGTRPGDGAGASAESVTVVEPNPRRHEALERLGASRLHRSIDDIPNGAYFDTVFDVVGVPDTRRRSIELAARGGTVVAVGLGADTAPAPWFDLVRREITVRGANTFGARDFELALEMLDAGELSPPADRSVVTLDQSEEVFTALAEGRAAPRKFFVSPRDAT